MKRISDNDLDEFFRNSVRNSKWRFNPKAWKHLEKKLDHYYSKRAFTRKVVYSSLVLILLICVIFLSENVNFYDNHGQKRYLEKSELSKGRLKDKSTGKNQPSNFNSLKKSYQATKIDENVFATKSEISGVRTEIIISTNSSLTDNTTGFSPINNLSSKSFDLSSFNVHLPALNWKEKDFKIYFTNGESKRPDYINYRIKARISLLISPDLSSSSGIGKINSGYNSGIILEYFPFRNLSITTGILKSKKVYDEKPGNYASGYGSSKDPIKIAGDCSITDIPINLRFFYPSNYRFKAFVSAGVSSYLMRREVYTFQYSNYEKTYNYRKQNNHLFSVVNLSIGAEYQLGKHFSLAIEPFAKVPTVGVGAGKIKLRTVGAFLSLNYSLLKTNHK